MRGEPTNMSPEKSADFDTVFTVAQLGQYNIENAIVTDPLREDPSARAAYSANPGSQETASEAHPIQTVGDSTLARPDVAEAMETIYVYSGQGTENGVVDSIDSELAMEGLKWLRKNLDDESSIPVRQDVIEIRGKLKLAAESQTPAARLGTVSELTSVEQQRIAKREQKERHNQRADEELSSVIEGVEEHFPGIDLTGLLQLMRKVRTYEEDGSIAVETRTNFDKAVEQRVPDFLDDPRVLLRDLKAITAVRSFIHFSEGNFDIMVAKIDKVEDAITDEVCKTGYTDLTEEIVDRWFSALEEEPTTPISEKSGTLSWADVSEKLLANSRVLSNSLYLAAREGPHQFIDKLYMLADKGFDPEDNHRFSLAFESAGQVLRSPLAFLELRHSAILGEPGSRLRNQAMDIYWSLRHLGLKEISQPVKDVREKMDEADFAILSRAYPLNLVAKVLGRPRNDETQKTLITADISGRLPGLKHDALEAFKARVNSPEGKTTTLLGRLVHGRVVNLAGADDLNLSTSLR